MPYDRKNQPKCMTCNHASSFHGHGQTPCKALGCLCKKFKKPKAEKPAKATTTPA